MINVFFSYELEHALDTPELKHEFGASLHNLLRVCDFSALPCKGNTLDLTQDFGGTAGFLAQHFDAVDAVKLDVGKAQFSAQRFPDLTNVEHISTDINRLELPAEHYDFIYAGDTESLNLSAEATLSLFGKLRASLSGSGVMVLSLKNKDRLSKSLSVKWPKTETRVPYSDLYTNEHANLLSLADLDLITSLGELNDATGSNSLALFASYSATQGMPNLFSRAYLKDSDNALNHFYRIGSISNPNLNEYLLYKALKQQGKELFEFASRFVLIAGNNNRVTNKLYSNDFTHFAGTGRLPQWRTITSKKKRSDIVTKIHTNPNLDTDKSNSIGSGSATLLSQNVAEQKFQPGSLLIDRWLAALLHYSHDDNHDYDHKHDHSNRNNSDDAGFSKLVRQYYQWLQEIETRGEFAKLAYDLLPFNVVCQSDNPDSYRAIDPEWQVAVNITPDFVLFRALFWLAFENRALLSGFGAHHGFKNIYGFVRHYLNLVSSDESIQDFIALEEQAQLEISSTFNAKSIAMAMHQDFSASNITSHPKPVCQITWADGSNHFEQAQAVHIEWMPSSETQQLRASIKLVDTDKKWLRVDPIDNAGLFTFDSITLLDQNEKVVWQLNSHQQIADAAKRVNVVVSDNTGSVTSAAPKNFIALNEDPFLLFDLRGISNLSSVAEVRLSLSLCFEPNYHNALNSLRDIVAKQQTLLTELSNKGHETRADIDLLTNKLNHANNERLHQQAQLSELETLRQRSHDLEATLRRTPSARIKRAIRRLMSTFNNER